MKALILKPIMWNTKNYERPSGYPSQGGFAQEYGYGHEEWNNSNKRIWGDYKIFHTESPNRLLPYSHEGNLGIITTASVGGNQYAISVATNVFDNDENQREDIVEALSIYDDWKEIWDVELVRQKFNNNKKDFLKRWGEDCQWIRWRCPLNQYFHFPTPILLESQKISGKNKLVTMHSSYQAIYPEQILPLLGELPESIFDWLSSGEFDDTIINRDTRKFVNNFRVARQSLVATSLISNSANAPATQKYEYWVEGNRTVEPLHAELQKKYVDFLHSKSIQLKEDKNFVDVQYVNKKGEVTFVEIKPTENIETKYAIRMAIGQLLEYRYKLNHDAKLQIVLGNQPKKEEAEFVASLNITLVYYDSNAKTFHKAS